MESGQGTYHDSDADPDYVIGTQIPKYLYDGGSSSKHHTGDCTSEVLDQVRYGYMTNPNAQGEDISLSQGMGMSFTELLMSTQIPLTSQDYLQSNVNTMVEPMGAENKTFMITGRYASSQSMLLDVEEEEEEEYHPVQFGDTDEEEHDDQTGFHNENAHDDSKDKFYNWQFDDNSYKDETAEGKDQHVPDKENNSDSDNDGTYSKQNKDNYSDLDNDGTYSKQEGEETVDMDMPDGVEQLTPEDIRIFLENESVTAAVQASQEVIGHHAPHLNMSFNSDDEAYNFYNEYASICGFSVRKAGNYKDKRKTFTCNKFGKVVEDEVLEDRKKKKQERKIAKAGSGPPPRTRKRRTNVNPITGCKAKLVVTKKNDKWFVTNIELHHNHELSPPEETKFLPSHRHMTDQEKLFIRTFTSVKLPTRKIMAILTYLRGGKPKNVPYNKKYVSNVMTAMRLEDNRNDMMKVLAYFRKRQEEDPRFYYNFDLGEGNKVKCIFWSDGFS
ncbi:hypothetical protein QYE76_047917 [Lolium multiflorum]|uniref:FAR1 domain-containing protein n=1 Tax=Lolium multiflorum TaxID=4521 RepID=A0AAD8TPN5_LOLMU|nr:hypothetical protein QYE76_047917 [Lolium multiflorum]